MGGIVSKPTKPKPAPLPPPPPPAPEANPEGGLDEKQRKKDRRRRGTSQAIGILGSQNTGGTTLLG